MSGSKKRKANKYKPESFETGKADDSYTRFYNSMIDSSAYKSLSSSARTVLMVLKRQYKGNYTGDTVVCPYHDIQQYGLNTRTIKRAIMELEEKGFIKITYGTRQAKDCNARRQPNEYKFIGDWKNYPKKNSENTS